MDQEPSGIRETRELIYAASVDQGGDEDEEKNLTNRVHPTSGVDRSERGAQNDSDRSECRHQGDDDGDMGQRDFVTKVNG